LYAKCNYFIEDQRPQHHRLNDLSETKSFKRSDEPVCRREAANQSARPFLLSGSEITFKAQLVRIGTDIVEVSFSVSQNFSASATLIRQVGPESVD
jgi:hypothetical protein